MAVSTIKAILKSEISTVWDTVLAVEQYTWRSDLSRVEVLNEKQFIEYTVDGYPTTFTVTAMEPYARWEFDMENTHMKGHWIGRFSARSSGTEIEFTEEVEPKRLFLKPFIQGYLKKQQARFLADLQKALMP